MKRRSFIQSAAATGIGALVVPGLSSFTSEKLIPGMSGYSKYRGFNLLEKFGSRGPGKKFQEEDFEIMAEWGFDFA